VLDSYFKLTNKSYLIDRLWYDLIRFFDHLVVAYFFGGHHVYEKEIGFISCGSQSQSVHIQSMPYKTKNET